MSWAWWRVPEIRLLRLRQDYWKFKAILGYTVKPCLNPPPVKLLNFWMFIHSFHEYLLLIYYILDIVEYMDVKDVTNNEYFVYYFGYFETQAIVWTSDLILCFYFLTVRESWRLGINMLSCMEKHLKIVVISMKQSLCSIWFDVFVSLLLKVNESTRLK